MRRILAFLTSAALIAVSISPAVAAETPPEPVMPDFVELAHADAADFEIASFDVDTEPESGGTGYKWACLGGAIGGGAIGSLQKGGRFAVKAHNFFAFFRPPTDYYTGVHPSGMEAADGDRRMSHSEAQKWNAALGAPVGCLAGILTAFITR